MIKDMLYVSIFNGKLYHLQVYLAKMKFNLAEKKFKLAEMKFNLAQIKLSLALTKFISCFLLAIFIFWHNFKKPSFLYSYNIILLVTNNINIYIETLSEELYLDPILWKPSIYYGDLP